MSDALSFTLASFLFMAGKIHIDRGDGTNLRTINIPNRKWMRACGNGEIMVVASSEGTFGACVFTRDGEMKQSIVTDRPIASCALSTNGLSLILGSIGGECPFRTFAFFDSILAQVICLDSRWKEKCSWRCGRSMRIKVTFALFHSMTANRCFHLLPLTRTMKPKCGRRKASSSTTFE